MVNQASTATMDGTQLSTEKVAPRLLVEIRRALNEACAGKTPESGDKRIIRASVEISRIEPLTWLNAQELCERIYWSGREHEYEIAGVGTTDIVEEQDVSSIEDLIAVISHRIDNAVGYVRYFGGIQFNDSRKKEDCWRSFGPWRFVVPRFEVSRIEGRTFIACNVDYGRDAARSDTDWLDEIGSIARIDVKLDGKLPTPLERADSPDRSGWDANIQHAFDSFDRGELEKIVLARRSSFKFGEQLNPVSLLKRLKTSTPDCFHFCFMPDHTAAFIGASPERLYKRSGRSIWSEAVAGTRPRSDEDEADRQFAMELLNSEKDLREHNYVRDSIRNVLEPVCTDISVDSHASLLRLARGQHLFTGFKAELKPVTGDDRLLRLLHPTPALGGCPTSRAVAVIDDVEPFERGWYGGPVGWIARNRVEFAVAIRSGLVAPCNLSIYSGAGIVQGSTPDQEWDEIEHKISDFINLLTNT